MKTILTILVALGIPAAFWNYYLKDSPDVQYTLSAAIPLAFPDEPKSPKDLEVSSEFVQQIEVANSGRGEAKKIIVKIPKSITQYHLSKHTMSEQVEIFNTSTGFELSYPDLPPSNGFQITLKTSGSPLTESQLQVFHQGGSAKIVSPGSRSSNTTLWNWALILIPFFYLWILYISGRDEFKYRYLFQHYSHDVVKLLRNKKPWYIRQSDWPEVITDLLSRVLTEPVSLYSAINTSTPYKLLNSDKPDEIQEDKWGKLKETASDRLLDAVKLQANRFSRDAEISDILNTQWPIGLSEANRVALMHSISVIYCDKMLSSSSVEDLVKKLSENQKPPKVSTEAWDSFKKKAEMLIAQSLARTLIYEDNIDSAANPPGWEVMPYFEKERLSKLQAGRIAAADASKKLQDAKELREKLFSLEQELKSRESKLTASESQNATSRAKIYRRLEVIEQVIADPAYLDRIESDDDTFATGNWAILRKFATKNQ